VKRRDFILGLGGAVLYSNVGRAQQTSFAVGVLEVGKEGSGRSILAPALSRLAEMGFVEGRNLVMEYRGADNQQDRLTGLARELVERRVAAIVTMGGPPTVAAKAATTSVPIIFRTGFDPVESGYVKSLNRPGGNVTGIHILNAPAIFKRIEILHELVPEAKSLAFFYTQTGDPTEGPFYQSLEQAAEPLGVNVLLFSASRPDQFEEIFTRAKEAKADAIVVNDHPVFSAGGGKPIVDLAARYKLPTMYPNRTYVAGGGLVSYGSDNKEANRQLGDLLGRVLKGEKPEDLPVQQVTKLELVINAKTAKSLSLEIPPLLLGLAEVIE
jgi:ABC-type uncharacterized transport system substrate-binding protein